MSKKRVQKRGRRHYVCQHPGCEFDGGASSRKMQRHYEEHPEHRTAAQNLKREDNQRAAQKRRDEKVSGVTTPVAPPEKLKKEHIRRGTGRAKPSNPRFMPEGMKYICPTCEEDCYSPIGIREHYAEHPSHQLSSYQARKARIAIAARGGARPEDVLDVPEPVQLTPAVHVEAPETALAEVQPEIVIDKHQGTLKVGDVIYELPQRYRMNFCPSCGEPLEAMCVAGDMRHELGANVRR